MLTFFRRIRKGLLDSNQARKYLLYAVGEIALVVIGILIALQINNWNEWRRDRATEMKILEEVAVTLETNCELLQEKIEWVYERNRSSEIILDVLKNKGPYSDTLPRHFHRARHQGVVISLKRAGYEGLKDAGLSILTNDTIKNEVVNLFDVTYPSMMDLFDHFELNGAAFDQQIHRLFLNESNHLIPFDYVALLEDSYYLSIVTEIKNRRHVAISPQLSFSLKESQRVLQLIKDELDE